MIAQNSTTLSEKWQITVRQSNGRSRGGKTVVFIRPSGECNNRSRKVSGFGSELTAKIENCIKKWYSPMVIYYEIDGKVIGSNSKENALKEYWRICELSEVGKPLPVLNHLKQ